MKYGLLLACVVTGLSLAACTAKKLDYRTMTPEELAKSPDFMPIFPSAPEGGTFIGALTATVCQHQSSEPAATTDQAVKELKRTAAMRGARALGNVSMRTGTVRLEECMTSAEATGDAYAIPNQ